jgi:hypothetical protein
MFAVQSPDSKTRRGTSRREIAWLAYSVWRIVGRVCTAHHFVSRASRPRIAGRACPELVEGMPATRRGNLRPYGGR